MAWAAPPTIVSGTVITSGWANAYVRDNTNYLHDRLDNGQVGSGATLLPVNDSAFTLDSGGGNPFVQFDTGDQLLFTRADNYFHFRFGGVDKAIVGAAGDFAASSLAIDANCKLYSPGAGTIDLLWDSNDYLRYDRATNVWLFVVGGSAIPLAIDGATGKLTGTGFYRSAEVGIANGATANFTHGLGARPSWVGGFYAAVSGTEDSLTSPINVGAGSTGVAITTGGVTSTIVTVSNNSGAGIAARVYAIR